MPHFFFDGAKSEGVVDHRLPVAMSEHGYGGKSRAVDPDSVRNTQLADKRVLTLKLHSRS